MSNEQMRNPCTIASPSRLAYRRKIILTAQLTCPYSAKAQLFKLAVICKQANCPPRITARSYTTPGKTAKLRPRAWRPWPDFVSPLRGFRSQNFSFSAN
jgi:hypothetical protein